MLIIVEGCIGAGKSTVAKGLAEYRGSRLLLESFESNPFLTAFYEDPKAYALETEFTFLLLHFHQLKSQRKAISTCELIADFHIQKDLLYANLNIADRRTLNIFCNLYGMLAEETPEPALMIFLSATTELLIERIRHRHRDIEMKIETDYYARVNAAYDEFFDRYDGPKINVPMDEWDFVKSPRQLEKLSYLVNDALREK